MEMRNMGFGIKTKMPVAYVRSTKYILYADVNSENEIIRKLWELIVKELVCAAIKAGVTSLIASPAASLPSYLVYLQEGISKLQDAKLIWDILRTAVTLRVDKTYENWSKV